MLFCIAFDLISCVMLTQTLLNTPSIKRSSNSGRKMPIMISRLCLVRNKSILAILDSFDFGRIPLREVTVIALCSGFRLQDGAKFL